MYGWWTRSFPFVEWAHGGDQRLEVAPSSVAMAAGDPGSWSGRMNLANSRPAPPSGASSRTISVRASGDVPQEERVAAVAHLSPYRGGSREGRESDLPLFVDWCRDRSLTHLQFKALLTAARTSANPNDFALVCLLGLLRLRVFEATTSSLDDLGEEHGTASYRSAARWCWSSQCRPGQPRRRPDCRSGALQRILCLCETQTRSTFTSLSHVCSTSA
jgi:hypothetical protein